MRERLRVLRHHDFRTVWLAQSTSAIGDSVVIVAIALGAPLVLVGGAILTAIVLALGLIPRDTRTLTRATHGAKV